MESLVHKQNLQDEEMAKIQTDLIVRNLILKRKADEAEGLCLIKAGELQKIQILLEENVAEQKAKLLETRSRLAICEDQRLNLQKQHEKAIRDLEMEHGKVLELETLLTMEENRLLKLQDNHEKTVKELEKVNLEMNGIKEQLKDTNMSILCLNRN
jgi:hypothetical protein